MKSKDWTVVVIVFLIIHPFFFYPQVFEAYRSFNGAHGYIASFIKFAILATFGESIGLRIRTGEYSHKGFGFLPRAIVWGFLGVVIKMAFDIFGAGAPVMLGKLCDPLKALIPANILAIPGFSWMKLLAAFTVSTTMNLFFAPVFMTFHKITDMHILANKGTLGGFFTPIKFTKYFTELDWSTQWNFVFKKTIPIFWIPAHTLSFMLPEEYRVLFAAVLSVVLGILLSVATLYKKK